MALSHIKTVNADTFASSGNFSATLSLQAHDTVIVPVRIGSISSDVSISDNLGNTYSLITSDGTNNWPLNDAESGTTAIFLCKDAAAGTATVSFSKSDTGSIRGHAMQLRGLDNTSPVDKATYQDHTGSGGTISSGTTGTRSQADEILVGFFFDDSSPTFTVGSGYTLPTNGTTSKTAIEYKIVSATGIDAATIGIDSGGGNCLGAITTLKAAAAASAVFTKSVQLNQAPNRASTY